MFTVYFGTLTVSNPAIYKYYSAFQGVVTSIYAVLANPDRMVKSKNLNSEFLANKSMFIHFMIAIQKCFYFLNILKG